MTEHEKTLLAIFVGVPMLVWVIWELGLVWVGRM